MRKPLRPGRRFAAGRRLVGKSSRAAEQTGSGKGVWETAGVPAAAPAASETAGVWVTAGVWENGVVPVAAPAASETAGVWETAGGPAASETAEGQESEVDRAAGQVGRVTGQRSTVASAAKLAASVALGEAVSQQRSRDLGRVAMCVTRARAAPRAGAEKCERQAAASRVVAASRVAAVVAAGASRAVAVAVSVAVAVAGGEAGVVRVTHQP
jgi:hypothetical protein